MSADTRLMIVNTRGVAGDDDDVKCGWMSTIVSILLQYLRLEHFCGTGSVRNRPFGSPVAEALAWLFLTSLIAANVIATQQQAVSVKSVSFICKRGKITVDFFWQLNWVCRSRELLLKLVASVIRFQSILDESWVSTCKILKICQIFERVPSVPLDFFSLLLIFQIAFM